jgi:hypothetical protein
MIIKVTLKEPDDFYEAIMAAVADDVAAIPGLDAEEHEAVLEARQTKTFEKMAKWLRYGEYVDLIFDTDTMTATVKVQE